MQTGSELIKTRCRRVRKCLTGWTMGIRDPNRVYDTDDLAPGKKIIFAATGVTDGALLKGVRFFGSGKRTHSVVMTTESRHIRFVDTLHIEGGPDTVIRF